MYQAIFETLLKSDHIKFCIADNEGYYQFVSRGFCRATGYSESDLITEPFLKFVSPETREHTKRVYEEAIANDWDINDFENEYIKKNGERIWFRWHSEYIPEHKVFVANPQDITAEVKLKSAMKTANINEAAEALERVHFFSRAVNSVYEQVAIADSREKIIFANDQMIAKSKYSFDEIKGKSLADVFACAQGEEYKQKVLKGKEYLIKEADCLGKDGNYYRAQISISPILDEKSEQVEYIVVVAREI